MAKREKSAQMLKNIGTVAQFGNGFLYFYFLILLLLLLFIKDAYYFIKRNK